IVALSEGSEFSLVDTHTNELAHITWVYIKDGNKQLYISNKVLLTNVSWNILNYKGMIYGTPVTIDGTEYKLRSLTKTEWQNIVENQSNITG
ncbi:hypothetical protein, partial [Rosenbergiella nectarea]